ncbi:MAG TPA: hypothetical protein VGI22_14850, partial [Xanthobacteraceae bacterium]
MSHFSDFKNQADFAADDTLAVNGDETIWTPGTPGGSFYSLVLSKGPKTVGAAIEMAGALEQPITAKAVQGHLRWAYTVKGGWLSVNGDIFAQPVIAAPLVPADVPEQPVALPVASA